MTVRIEMVILRLSAYPWRVAVVEEEEGALLPDRPP
jgi:hypothetical protein